MGNHYHRAKSDGAKPAPIAQQMNSCSVKLWMLSTGLCPLDHEGLVTTLVWLVGAWVTDGFSREDVLLTETGTVLRRPCHRPGAAGGQVEMAGDAVMRCGSVAVWQCGRAPGQLKGATGWGWTKGLDQGTGRLALLL